MASCVLVHFQGLHSDKALFRMPVSQRSYREQEIGHKERNRGNEALLGGAVQIIRDYLLAPSYLIRHAMLLCRAPTSPPRKAIA